jgi:hypothetical protein
MLGPLVHVAEAGEAVTPRDLARLVEYEAASLTATVFKLPCASRAPVYTIFLVSEDMERRSASVLVEAPLEEAANAGVFAVLVLLHGVGLLLLPLPVFLEGFAGGQ